MAIHVYIDGQYYKRYETTQELNADKLGNVAISKHDKRSDGDSDLYMISIKEESQGMNRIEEIKRRVERLNYFQKEVSILPPTPGPTETGARQKITMDELRAAERIIESNALKDVPYLLERLEIAEKALLKIEDYWEANITVKTYAGDALKQIRE